MIPDFLILGRLVLDATDEGLRPGGAVFYASHAASRLGQRTGIITNGRPDHDVAAALPPDAALQTVGCATTVFENHYTLQGRWQRVRGAGPPISRADVPQAWQAAAVALIAPVFNDVDQDVVGVFRHSLVGVAPQGWMRSADRTGLVTRTAWTQARAAVSAADAVVLSIEDLGGDEEQVRQMADVARLLVVTEGAAGCRVFIRGTPHQVPGFAAQEREPTGAGDVFAAAFVIRLAECGDPLTAAVFANAVAAGSVEAEGVSDIPTRSAVDARVAHYTR